MRQVNIHEAKTRLSELIASGEEIVIARYGQPVAKLMPIKSPLSRHTPGSAKGMFTLPPEFFMPLPEDILEGFER